MTTSPKYALRFTTTVLTQQFIFHIYFLLKMLSSLKRYFGHSSEELKITNTFKPLYVVLSILGLFPYSVQFHKNKGCLTIIKKSIYLNSLCAVFYIILICTFLVVHVLNVYNSISDTAMTKEIMTQMNYIVELVNCVIFCLVAYICAFRNRFKYVKIINSIGKLITPTNRAIDEVLKNFRVEVNVVVVGSLMLLLVLQICINFSRDSTFWKMILVTFSFVLPQMIQFTTIAFYYVLILMLVILLQSIREHISIIVSKKNNVLEYVLKVETKLVTLKNAETLYVNAFKLKRDINEVFQAPMLITTLQSFHSIISEAHIIYHGITVEGSLSAHAITNCTFWIIYQFMKICVLARSGDLLKLEIQKTGQALHRIPTDRFDLKLLMEIQHFSSLMSYQGNEITVYGFFLLDATLVSKIIASSAMYLIILVQFDKK